MPRGAVRPLEGGARRAPGGALRLRGRRARAVALRRPVLPGGAGRGRRRPRPVLRGAPTSSSSSRRTFDGIGLETRDVLERSDLFPREGKCQHAFCIDVDRAGDIRVLANVVPSQQWMDTMLHELGHATFDAGLRPLAALAAARLAPRRHGGDRDPDGAARQRPRVARAGARASTRTTVAAIAPTSARARAAELLVFTRWVLVMTNFERALYADPEADLDARWWELVSASSSFATPRAGAPGLGREDPRRLRARLLPHLPLRPPRRLAARGDARAGVRRPRRPAGGRQAARRAGVRAGPLAAVGPADRAGDRRAADRGPFRPRHRRGLTRALC